MAPSTARERAVAAAGCAQAGKWQQACELLDFEWRQDDADAAGLAGAALLHLGMVEPALVALDHAAAAPGLAERGACLLNLGRALLLNGKAERSLATLAQAEPLFSPPPALWLLSRVEALVALARIDEALALIPEQFEDIALIKARVMLLGATTRHEEAADLLTRARHAHRDDIDLIVLSAELAMVRGRDAEAAMMLHKALALHPDDIGLLARQAMLAQPFHISAASRAAASRAMALAEAEDDPAALATALCAHAHVQGADDNMIEAEATWRRVLDIAPDHVPALSGLGHLQLATGQVDEAIALFRRVQAIAPLQGWSQLIHARQLPDDPAVLDHIEAAALIPGLEGPVRSSLLFLLATAHDRQKQYDKAFSAARRANDAARALLDYRPQHHRAAIERIIARFSAAFIAERANWGHPSTVPVFIVGMPRSGTTLAEQILSGHSGIYGAGELGLSGEFIGGMNAWEHKLGSGLSYPECLADMTQDDIARLAGRWLKRLREHDGTARHVIDKLPHNFEHIGLIRLMFPNARILSCRREARDIAVSNYITDYAAKFGGMGFAYDLAWIGEQIADHDRLMAHWHAVFPGAVLDVVYEDTVNDTEGQARRMLDFLGLDWEPSVLAFQSVERRVRTASTWQVRQPVYSSSKARWRHYATHLAPLEQALARTPPPPAPLPQPTLPPGQFLRGMALLKQGHAAAAENTFVQLIAAMPNHAAAYHFLGVAQAQQKRLSDARNAIAHATQLHPIHAAWYENLAHIEQALGNAAGASVATARARQLRAQMQTQMSGGSDGAPL